MAGEDKTLRLFVLYDGASADEGMARTATVAEETSNKIGGSGTKAGEKFGSEMEKGTTRAGSAFSKLGNQLSSWGIPFSGQLTKIGNELSTTGSKAQGFGHAMSLAGGVAIAAAVGVGVEAVKMSDKFDVAQANLQTAVRNSGGVWANYSAEVSAAAKTTGALVTGNATDVDAALATLTTATGSAQKALGELNLTENIAATRHISLADAAGLVAKVYAGSTRVLTQFGINLDIGSGKLHSIQAAEEAVQRSTLNLEGVQARHNAGLLVGVNYNVALAQAQMSLRNANLNLSQSQQAVSDALGALNTKFQGAAAAVGKTLPGEIDIAKHSLDNMGISLGQLLIPKLEQLTRLGAQVLGFFEKNKLAGEAFAAVLGTFLTAAVASFVYSGVAKVVGGIGDMIGAFTRFGVAVDAKLGIVTAASAAEGTAETTLATTSVAAQEAIQNAWATTAAAIESMSATEFTTFGELDASWTTLAADASASVATIDGAIATMVAADEAAATAMEEANVAAGLSFDAMLGPIGLVLAAVGGLTLGFVALENAIKRADEAKVTSQYATESLQQQATTAIKTGDTGKLNQVIGQLKAEEGSGGAYTITPSRPVLSQYGATAGRVIGHTGEQKSPGEIALEKYVTGLEDQEGRLRRGGAGTGPSYPSPTGGAPTNPLTKAQEIVAQSEVRAAQLGEKGLTGLALSAQKALVSLDKISANQYATPEQIAKAQAAYNIAEAKAGNAIPNLGNVPTIGGGGGTQPVSPLVSKAQSELGTLQNAILNNSLKALRDDTVGVHKTIMEELRSQLLAAHNASDTALANQLESTFAQAQNQLRVELGVRAQTAYADWLTKEAAATTARTTAFTNAQAAEINIINAGVKKQTDAISAAAQNITQSATILTDASNALVQGITDSTTLMNERSAAQVQQIQAQNQTQVDILGERGLYGLQLVAQQQKVILDQQTAIDDAKEAAATAHLDQIQAHENQLVDAAKTHADQVTLRTNIEVQAAQQRADTTTVRSAVELAKAQANSDQIAIRVAVADAAAQAHVDAVQYGTALQQAQAQAAEKQTQAQGAKDEATAGRQLAATTAQTNKQDTSAQNAYALAQANAARTQAQANAAYAQAQATAAQQVALAQKNLSSITDAANKQLSLLQAQYNLTSAEAAVQFAGSGLIVNQYGLDHNNAQANVSALSWAARTNKV